MTRYLPIALACLLPACASTKVSVDNKEVFRTGANASKLVMIYPTRFGPIHLEIDNMDHSTPTLAGGQAFALGMDSFGRVLVSGGLAFGSSGLSKVASGVIPVAGAITTSVAQTTVKPITPPKNH